MYYDEPTFEDIMNDTRQTIEERMNYFLDEADLRFHEGFRPMDVQMFFDAVSDVYRSTYSKYKQLGRDMGRTEQMQFSRLRNTCQYLEDCLKNPGIGWMQPDVRVMRQFWEKLSTELYIPLQKQN